MVTSLHLSLPQVTKKRVSANKKNQETREFYSAAQTVARNQLQKGPAHAQSPSQSDAQAAKAYQCDTGHAASSPSPTETGVMTTDTPYTPPRLNAPQSTGHTPGSASKRKHRKLAVNFEAAKVSE